MVWQEVLHCATCMQSYSNCPLHPYYVCCIEGCPTHAMAIPTADEQYICHKSTTYLST